MQVCGEASSRHPGNALHNRKAQQGVPRLALAGTPRPLPGTPRPGDFWPSALGLPCPWCAGDAALVPTLLRLPVSLQVYLTNLGAAQRGPGGSRMPAGVRDLSGWRGLRPESAHPVGGRGGLRPGGCRVATRPRGGTLVPRPARSGGPLGADPRWPGTLQPLTQPRAGDVVRRRRRRYAPPPPARGRAGRRRRREPGAAGGRGEAGRGRRRGSRCRARRSTKSGAAPSAPGPAPGPGGRGDRLGCRGRPEGEGPRPGRDCGAPWTLPGPLVAAPAGGRDGAGPLGVVASARPSCRRSCGRTLHAGQRRRSSSLAGTGAPRAEPAGAGP